MEVRAPICRCWRLSTPWEHVAGGPAGQWTSWTSAYPVRQRLPSYQARARGDRVRAAVVSAGRPILQAAHDLTQRVFGDFTFDSTATDISTPLSVVLKHRRGVCQDFAHLAIACLRAHGLAARYVSGYLQTAPPPGIDKLIGADASHAWFAVYHPGLGWVDFDPTNNHATDATSPSPGGGITTT